CRLSDRLDHLLGYRVTHDARASDGALSRQPGIGSIAGSRARSRIIGGASGTDGVQHLGELQLYRVGGAQRTDTVLVLDLLVVQAQAQVLGAFPGQAEVSDHRSLGLDVGVTGATALAAHQGAASQRVYTRIDLAAVLVGIEGTLCA